MLVSEFDFELPEELIAQYPADRRDESRLLVLHYKSGRIEHRKFKNIVEYLNQQHVLVLNNTKVIKARIYCHREDTGGKIEFLLVGIQDNKTFLALARPSRKAKPGIRFVCGKGRLEVAEYRPGYRVLRIISPENVLEFFERYGVMPLPPYIKRPPTQKDEYRYQTVYARKAGSVAAPTAGLHFTPEVLTQLRDKGVDILEITLHVGPGTFKPVKTDKVEEHKMDAEYYEIPKDVAQRLKDAKKRGKKIISVGTTSTRTLESWAFDDSKLSGYTRLFIYPGYKYKVIDGLLTNFHLPRSTPLLLVAALSGIDMLKKAYKEAIKEKYRFFSYGDAMLLLDD